MLWAELRTLAVGTARLWWRLLPQLLGIYLLGWLGAQLSLKLAAQLGDVSAWLALGIFSLHFLCQLVAIVVILQLCGRELRIRDTIPDAERVDDGRDTSLTRLLALTLLPFLALYAAFGQVSDAAIELSNEQLFRSGAFSNQDSVLGVLNVAATQYTGWLVLLLVGIYLIRRLLDAVHERTGIQVFGLLVALVESFFLLLVIMGGIRVWQQVRNWLADRAVAGWLDAVRNSVLDVLRTLWSGLPDIVVQTAEFVRDEIWPLFWEVLSQPIIWLAVAALVFGSNVTSLAELWRKGQPLASRLPGAAAIVRRAEKRSERVRHRGEPRLTNTPRGVRLVAGEARELLLGDVNDKYLPTIHSIRLVLRAGVIFLAAFVVLYTLIEVAANLLQTAVRLILGGHTVAFWFLYGPYLDLLYTVPFEPLRLCLLAVAFYRCLEIFRAKLEAPVGLARSDPAPVAERISP